MKEKEIKIEQYLKKTYHNCQESLFPFVELYRRAQEADIGNVRNYELFLYDAIYFSHCFHML